MKHIIVTFLFFFIFAKAIDIGSDTAVTHFNTPQVLYDGDRIAGFTTLTAGFILDHGLVTGTFDCFFPVSGTINLNFGTLVLNKDLILQHVASITNLGSIIGNDHVVEFSKTMTCLPSQSSDDIDIFSIDLLVTVGPLANDIWSVAWSHADNYIGLGLQSVMGDKLLVYNWDGASLTFGDGVDLGGDVFAVDWHPTNNWIAAGMNGGLLSTNVVYIYSYNGRTLTLLNEVTIGGLVANAVNTVKWHPSGNYLAVGTDGNQILVYPVNGGGVLGTPLTVAVSTEVNSLDWNQVGNYLAVGTAGAGGGWNEFRVYAFSTAPLSLRLNASTNTDQAVLSVSWNKVALHTDIIAIGLAGGTNRLQIYRHTPSTLTSLPTGLGVGTSVTSLSWYQDCLLVSFLSNASSELGRYSFANDMLSFEEGFEYGTAVNSVAWSHNNLYAITGDDAETLSLYRRTGAFVDKSSATFSNVEMIFNQDTTFKNCSINFEGTCIINGRNRVLTLDNTCSFTVLSNSTLEFINTQVVSIDAEQITNQDDTAKIILNNVIWKLDGDFQFKRGSMDIINVCQFFGNNFVFYYESSQPLTIFEHSSLGLNEGLIFDYCPTNSFTTLLKFANRTAMLNLLGGTLLANQSLELKKGTINVLLSSYLSAASGREISIGDQNTSANDCRLIINSGLGLYLVEGTLSYKNILSSSLNMVSFNSILHLLDNTRLNVFQDMMLGSGIIEFHEKTVLGRSSGKRIIGSTHTLGRVSAVSM